MRHILFIAIALASFLSISRLQAQNRLDEEINVLVNQITQQLSNKPQIRSLAVADFTQLDGQPSPLGRFLAEELRTSLITATRSFTVINRSQLQVLLKEVNMDADGVLAPSSAARLGRINGMDAIVFGTLMPAAGFVRVNLQVVELATTDAIAAAKGNIIRTPSIIQVEQSNLAGSSTPASGASGTPTEVKPVQPTQPSAMMPTYQVLHLLVEVLSCHQTGNRIECRLKISSRDRDTDLHLYQSHSRIISAPNSVEYQPSSMKMAEAYGTNQLEKTIVADNSIEVVLYFSNIRADIQQISRLDLHGWSRETGSFTADLRNIKVSRTVVGQ